MISEHLRKDISQSVTRALQEDVGSGDITGQLIAEDYQCTATLIAREKGIFCGMAWLTETFKQVDPKVTINWQIQDGETCKAEQILCELSGSARSLFTGERTAMNFIQTLSATATKTAEYVAKLKNTKCQLLDTRKTIPNLRLAQKYAVFQGGGKNHRIGLYDAILIKENHIHACGGVKQALTQAQQLNANTLIEIEVENLDEFEQALKMQTKRILLDNFTLKDLKHAVKINNGQSELEASGNITLTNIEEYAKTGVNFISVGAITKHIHALDLSLRIK